MNGALVLNPLTVASRTGQHELLLRCFARGRSFRNVRVVQFDEPELFTSLIGWIAGENSGPVPADLPRERMLQLWSAGLLITEQERQAWPETVRPEIGKGHAHAALLCGDIAELLSTGPVLAPMPPPGDSPLSRSDYCSLSALVAPGDMAAMRRYYAVLCEQGWLRHDASLEKRRVIHNDPVGLRVHHALAAHATALAGTEMKPSFSYFAEHTDGSDLPRHRDRPQCEITISLYLDYLPGPDGVACPWPLVMHTPDGDMVIRQDWNGAAAFRGRFLDHSRPPLPPGHSARFLLLCYVPEHFSGALE